MKFSDLFLYKYSSPDSFELDNADEEADFPVQKNHGGPLLSGNFKKDSELLKKEFSYGVSGDMKIRELILLTDFMFATNLG